MKKKNQPLQRIDPNFERDMREVAKTRLERGLAKLKPTEVSIAEMTRLLRRTDHYKGSLEELKTKPKKENVKL